METDSKKHISVKPIPRISMYELRAHPIFKRTEKRVKDIIATGGIYEVIHKDKTIMTHYMHKIDVSKYKDIKFESCMLCEKTWRSGFCVLFNDIEYDEIVKCLYEGNIDDVISLGGFTCLAECEPVKHLNQTFYKLIESYGYVIDK